MGNLGVARPTRAMTNEGKPCFRCKVEERLPGSSYCRGCYNARKTRAARAARKALREKL